MKAIVYTIVVITTVVILIFAGIYIYSQIINAPLADFLSSTFAGCGRGGQECCKNDWCVTGLVCSGNICIENITYQIMIDESYLIYNSSETASRSGRNEFFLARTGLGWEDCSNGQNCQNCYRIFNFNYATACTDCSYCDSDSKTCRSCLACNSAENGKYSELYECYDCSNCQNVLYDLADSCSQCSFCNVANVTTIENDLSCSKCFQCDENRCYSCYDCDGTEDKVCNECDGTGRTNCKTRQDYELCKKVIECIANFEGESCEIEEILPLPWNSGIPFNSQVSNILTSCLTREAKREIIESISQKICTYDTSKINFIRNDYISDDTSYVAPSNLVDMLTSNNQYSSVTGETKGILFNDCGIKKTSEPFSPPDNEIIYSSDPEIFSSSTTPRTPVPERDIPVNLKIIVSNVSWKELYGNDCSYNVFLCAQEAIATSEDDPILYLYRNFSYFNESDYPVQINKWPSVNAEGYQVNVTAIKYPPLKLNLSGRNADVAHIAKAFIAGLRDYFIFNSYYNQTVSFFCINSGLYPDSKTCYLNNVSVFINDNVPWSLTSFSSTMTISNSPEFKYIYYDSSNPSYSKEFEIELVFFVYTSNIAYLKNKIFITPMIFIKPVVSPFVSSLIINAPIVKTCSIHTTSSDCTADGCKWCPKCGPVGFNLQINTWKGDKCVDTSTDCGYHCSPGDCGAECDPYYTSYCSPPFTCKWYCKCEL